MSRFGDNRFKSFLSSSRRRSIRELRPLRGGVGSFNSLVRRLDAFYPNSANWQQMSLEVVDGLDSLPRQMMLLVNLYEAQEFETFEIPEDSELSSRLESLFDHYGSDKGRNGYSNLYSGLLAQALTEQRTINILEIGIGSRDPHAVSTMAWTPSISGGSLRAFAALDPRVRVLGLDYDQQCLFSESTIETRWCNQLNPASLDDVRREFADTSFDLIVDDGLHFVTANLNSLLAFLPLLRTNGFFVVEDIPTRSFIVWEVLRHLLHEKGFLTALWEHPRGSGANLVVTRRAHP